MLIVLVAFPCLFPIRISHRQAEDRKEREFVIRPHVLLFRVQGEDGGILHGENPTVMRV